MKNYYYILKQQFYKVTRSIAFLPSIISSGFLLLAFVSLYYENGTTEFLKEYLPTLIINNADTARSILSTLIGSILSLTVFSFSMVMLLLNQASSDFSPRLLPGLISNKNNQLVLGIFLGTIIYNIIVLISILPSGESYIMNGFSILVGIIMGVISLAFFVFFIHSISNDIQIDNILKSIFDKTVLSLKLELEERNHSSAIHTELENINLIKSNKASYFDGVKINELKEFADKYKTDILIKPYKGEYLLPNTVLAYTSKKIDKEASAKLENCLSFSPNQKLQDNYILGIKQIMETGIKSMSPGINDPGTAILTIDYITELLALRMQFADFIHLETNSQQQIRINNLSFKGLLYQTLAPFRTYCSHDIIVINKLLNMLNYLLDQDSAEENYYDLLHKEKEAIFNDAKENIKNSEDIKTMQYSYKSNY